jgi:hypothetical protein
VTIIKCKRCGNELGDAAQDCLTSPAFSVVSGVVVCNACGASRCWGAANGGRPLAERTRRLLRALGVEATAQELEQPVDLSDCGERITQRKDR